MITMVEYRPMSLAELARDADAVLLATVTAVEEVHPAPDSVRTRCTVQGIKTYKPLRGAGLLDGKPLVVEREGGTLPTQKGKIEFREHGFPMFRVGETYLIFLCAKPHGHDYEVCSGPQGTWRFNDDAVQPLQRLRDVGAEPRPIGAVATVVQKSYYSTVNAPLGNADIQAMLQGDLDQTQIAEFVRDKGVNFALTVEIEKDLVARGARPEVLQAIATNRKSS